MIQPKLEDYEIEYYFVKDFKWFETNVNYKLNGFPPQNSVQRVIYNKAAKTRGIVMPTEEPGIDSLHLDHMNTKGLDMETVGYSADLVEITKKSILELNLSEDHLTQLVTWLESDNEDIMPYLKPTNQNLPTTVEPEEFIELSAAINIIGDLRNINRGHFNIIMELASRLLDDDNSYDPAFFVRNSVNGSGLNIGEAIRDLNAYLSGPKYGDDRDQLFSAITNIFSEIDRRDNLQLD